LGIFEFDWSNNPKTIWRCNVSLTNGLKNGKFTSNLGALFILENFMPIMTIKIIKSMNLTLKKVILGLSTLHTKLKDPRD